MSHGARFLLRSSLGEFILGDQKLVVGRGLDCDVVLDDGLASRRHALFRLKDDGVTLEDLGSRNGTLVNGLKIDSFAKLKVGDQVTVGAHLFQLRHAPPTSEERARVPEVPPGQSPTKTWGVGPETDATRAAPNVFHMLQASFDRAVQQESVPDAESAASVLMLSIRASAVRGQKIDVQTMNGVSDRAFALCELTESGRWLDRLCEAWGAARHLADSDRIRRLASLRARYSAEGKDGVLRQYILRMDKLREPSDEDGARRLAQLRDLLP